MNKDIRNIETRDSLEDAVEQVVQTASNGNEVKKLLAEQPGTYYQRMDDNSLLEMSQNPYDYFLIVKTVESGISYATGICYDKSLIQIIKNTSKYELKTVNGGNFMQFKIPLEELADTDLSSVMKKVRVPEGEILVSADELLYTSSDIYDQNNQSILLKKNLLTGKESTLLHYIYIELMNRMKTDSTITLSLLHADYEKCTLDIQVTETFSFTNGRTGTASVRKRVGYQM